MFIKAEELKAGDTLKTLWKGHPSTIKSFRPYTGPIDFVLCIAEFTDGDAMSLEKGHYYDCID